MGENLINHTLDKGLISRSYKELQKLNIKEIKLSVSKWTNKSNTQLVFFFLIVFPEDRDRQAYLYEYKASLAYISSSRPSRAV